MEQQHDFAVSHAAGSAYLAGDGSYDVRRLGEYSQRQSALPVVYPPVISTILAPFALLDHETTSWLSLALKLLALAGLLYVWKPAVTGRWIALRSNRVEVTFVKLYDCQIHLRLYNRAGAISGQGC